MYAFTELHSDYPAYVNLDAQPDGTLKLAVRQRGNSGKDYATIILPDAQAEELAEAIFKHVYAADAPTLPAKAGEIWHVRYNGGITLATVKVTEASEHTVCVLSTSRPYDEPSRYEWSDLKFIERATATNTNQPRKPLDTDTRPAFNPLDAGQTRDASKLKGGPNGAANTNKGGKA